MRLVHVERKLPGDKVETREVHPSEVGDLIPAGWVVVKVRPPEPPKPKGAKGGKPPKAPPAEDKPEA